MRSCGRTRRRTGGGAGSPHVPTALLRDRPPLQGPRRPAAGPGAGAPACRADRGRGVLGQGGGRDQDADRRARADRPGHDAPRLRARRPDPGTAGRDRRARPAVPIRDVVAERLARVRVRRAGRRDARGDPRRRGAGWRRRGGVRAGGREGSAPRADADQRAG